MQPSIAHSAASCKSNEVLLGSGDERRPCKHFDLSGVFRATAGTLGMTSQRYFYHIKVPYGSGTVTVPLVVLLHHEDVSALTTAAYPPSEALPFDDLPPASPAVPGSAVLRDILAILRLHGASILPLLSPEARAVVIQSSGGGTGRGASPQPTYHGELVSVRFSVRPGEDEGRYTLLTHSLEGGGVGGSAGGADDSRFRTLPVAGYTLYAHARHKLAEAERRKAALMADPAKVVKFAAGAGGSAAKKVAGAGERSAN